MRLFGFTVGMTPEARGGAVVRSPLSDTFWFIAALLAVTGAVVFWFNPWFLPIAVMSILAVLWVFNSIDAGVQSNAYENEKTKEKGKKKCC